MPNVVWDQLPERMELVVRKGEVFDRPAQAELAAVFQEYEDRAGFKLPLRYREFITWFGPGMFTGEWFAIAAPTPARFREEVGDVFDLDKQQEMVLDPEGYWASSCDPGKLKQLVLFASTEGGDWFFWDTSEVRNASEHEYAIYGHARHWSEAKVEFVALSFEAFITDVCLAPVYPLGSNEEREVEFVHEPAWTARRKSAK